MLDYSQELKAWAAELAEFHLPRWEELPTLSLYMDQVVAYINDTLVFLLADPNEQAPKRKREDRLLTAAMINNYVKQHFVPKPDKKRYHREHLACLIVYALFKQVLPLTDIQKGVYLQLALSDNDFQKAYDLFCEQVERALASVASVALEDIAEHPQLFAQQPLTVLGTSMSALALASKILAQKVLALNTIDGQSDYRVDATLAGTNQTQ